MNNFINLEERQKQYSESVENLKMIFESSQDEQSHLVENCKWIVESKDQLYKYDTGKGKTLVFGGGNVALISNTLLEKESINEDSGFWNDLWGAVKELPSYAAGAAGHIVDNLKAIGRGNASGVLLSVGALCEFFALASSFLPVLKPVSITLALLGGVGLLAGGIFECLEASKDMGSLEETAKRFDGSGGEENIQKLGDIEFDSNKAKKTKIDGVLAVKDIKSGKQYGVVRKEDGSYEFYKGANESLLLEADKGLGHPIDVFSNGTMHALMGVVSITVAPFGLLGGPGYKKAAETVARQVSMSLKEVFSKIMVGIAQRSFKKAFMISINKHATIHFGQHFLAAMLVYFTGKNLGKKSVTGLEKGKAYSILDFLTGLENIVKSISAKLSNATSQMKEKVMSTMGGYVDGIDNLIEEVFSAIEIFPQTLLKLVGAIVKYIKNIVEMIPAYQELFAKQQEAEEFEKLVGLAKKETEAELQQINKKVKDLGIIDSSGKPSREFTGPGEFKGTTMAQSSTATNQKYIVPDSMLEESTISSFRNFRENKKDVMNESNQNKRFKNFTEYNKMNEGISDWTREAFKQVQSYFNGLQIKVISKYKFSQKQLKEILNGSISPDVIKLAPPADIAKIEAAIPKLEAEIDSKKIKTFKQLVNRFADETGLGILNKIK
jgi:hypothetical protein